MEPLISASDDTPEFDTYRENPANRPLWRLTAIIFINNYYFRILPNFHKEKKLSVLNIDQKLTTQYSLAVCHVYALQIVHQLFIMQDLLCLFYKLKSSTSLLSRSHAFQFSVDNT